MTCPLCIEVGRMPPTVSTGEQAGNGHLSDETQVAQKLQRLACCQNTNDRVHLFSHAT